MRLYSPRHSKSSGLRRLARRLAVPLSRGVAALAAVLILLTVLVVVTITGSSSPKPRRAIGTTGGPDTTSSAWNLVADATFDHGIAAWRPLPGALLTRGSVLREANQTYARMQRDPSTPATTDPKTGRALFGMVMPVIQSASRGTRLHATVQVRATRSGVPVLLRLSELAGGETAARSEVRALLADTTWHLLKVDREIRIAGATVQVEVGALAVRPDAAVYVDNVRVLSRS